MSDFKQQLGRFGEDMAAAFLERNGYKIVARNYCGGRRELDIIASKGGVLSFIEVKTRTSQSYGLPEEAINWQKQRHLASAIEKYVFDHDLFETPYQVDSIAVEVDKANKRIRIRHLKNIILG